MSAPVEDEEHLLGTPGVEVPLDLVEDVEQLTEALPIQRFAVVAVLVGVVVVQIDLRECPVDLADEFPLDIRAAGEARNRGTRCASALDAARSRTRARKPVRPRPFR